MKPLCSPKNQRCVLSGAQPKTLRKDAAIHMTQLVKHGPPPTTQIFIGRSRSRRFFLESSRLKLWSPDENLRCWGCGPCFTDCVIPLPHTLHPAIHSRFVYSKSKRNKKVPGRCVFLCRYWHSYETSYSIWPLLWVVVSPTPCNLKPHVMRDFFEMWTTQVPLTSELRKVVILRIRKVFIWRDIRDS